MDIDILKSPVCCKVRKYNLKLTQNNIDINDSIEIEELIGLGCGEARLLENLYSEFCAKENQRRKNSNDPTTQEV